MLRLAKTDGGLLYADFDAGERTTASMLRFLRRRFSASPELKRKLAAFRLEAEALERYAAGDPKALTAVPLDLSGTPFMRSVWEAMRAIPFGETRSYKAVAAAIGAPKAVRAVARAVHDNPVLLFVPCHRVVGSSGALVGYRAGLEIKAALLEHERRALERGRRAADRPGASLDQDRPEVSYGPGDPDPPA
ncbi:MAG: methylated-DNA--[protein]-cysteine S-methyltransferase [Hydrogenibacillus sp.]|nr:methylated-DNA--[protein]-cysteine S-methyltransferase [Hydrogenibacillus sp.]